MLNAPPETSRLQETEVAQPAIFAMQVALTALWRAWGIEPEAVVGHSVGEIAAAHIAGVLSLEDAVRVVYQRSRLMQRVTGQGKMAALGLPRAQAEALCAGYSGLSVAAVNSPTSTVLSGDADALEEIVAALGAKGTFARLLPVNYAFHSPVMDSLTAELVSSLRGLALQPARIALYSTVRGERAKEGDYDAPYWARNIRQPVLFGQTIQTLAGAFHTFVEVSPHPVLSESINQCLEPGQSALVVPSLRRGQPERGVLLRSLGALYTRGYPLRWAQFTPHGRQVDLPHYPWQNARYWLPHFQPVHSSAQVERSQPDQALAQPEDSATWFYDLAWIEVPASALPARNVPRGNWLVLGDAHGFGKALVEQLMTSGHSATLAVSTEAFNLPAWLHSANNPQGIIDLRAIEARQAQAAPGHACQNAIETVQALLQTRMGQAPRLWLVTQGVQQVAAESVALAALDQSPLWGLGRTIALEQPELWGGLIDLETEASAEQAASMSGADALLRVILDPHGEDQIAIRTGKCYAARLAHSTAPPAARPHLADDGSYLITGGLGALGQQLAAWLVQNGARHLVLTSRSGLPARDEWQQIAPDSQTGRRISAVLALEAAGAQVTVAAADGTDEAQMAALFARFGNSLPALRGVIHAAGVVTTRPVEHLNQAALAEVLSPKAGGAWILHNLTQNLNLDFFVLFSSNSAVLGAAGLGHYAAANHYLDSLARARRALGLPGLSINWGWWAGEGIASAALADQFRQVGQQAMPVELALQALGALLASPRAQCMVAAIDWARFKPIYEARRRHPLLAQIAVDAAQVAAPQECFAQQLLAAPFAARFELLKAFVRETVGQILGFSAGDKIDPQQGFASLGMDSVMAVQLRLRLEASLEQPLPSTIAFEYPTLQTLAGYLADEILKLNAAPAALSTEAPAAASPQASSEDDLLAKLDAELAAINKLAEGE